MTTIKIWNDVIRLVNELREQYYKQNQSKNTSGEDGKKKKTYTSAQAMKEAWASKEVKQAREEYANFKKNHPAEWKRLNDEYTKNKKPRKKKPSKT